MADQGYSVSPEGGTKRPPPPGMFMFVCLFVYIYWLYAGYVL